MHRALAGLQKVRAWLPPVPSPCTLPTQGPACRTRDAGRAHPAGPEERPFPTFQRFLQGLGEAGRAVAIAVVPAWILPRGEGRGRQVKVHEGQVMASHLDGRRQSNRDRLRGFWPWFPSPPPRCGFVHTWAAGGEGGGPGGGSEAPVGRDLNVLSPPPTCTLSCGAWEVGPLGTPGFSLLSNHKGGDGSSSCWLTRSRVLPGAGDCWDPLQGPLWAPPPSPPPHRAFFLPAPPCSLSPPAQALPVLHPQEGPRGAGAELALLLGCWGLAILTSVCQGNHTAH